MFVGKICAYVCGFFINNNQNQNERINTELRERVNRNNSNSIRTPPNDFMKFIFATPYFIIIYTCSFFYIKRKMPQQTLDHFNNVNQACDYIYLIIEY